MIKIPVQNIQQSSLDAGWKYQIRRYVWALAAAMPSFVALSVYLFYRRGYYDLYIANKIFAEVAAILLGVVLLLGPLSRLFSFFGRYIGYRKELGIIAFFLALIHVFLSLFFLPSKFPLAEFLKTLYWPFIFGTIAIIFLLVVFLISGDRSISAVGKPVWRKLQYWGVRFSFVFVALHVFIMKWGGWVSWYKIGGAKDLMRPDWPGGGLLIGWFIGFVIFVRLAEFISPKLGRAACYISIIVLPVIYIATFLWGRQFIG